MRGDVASAQQAAPPPSVGVVLVKRKVVSLGDEYVGRVAAVDKVELKARIDGFLMKRNFAEGDLVSVGELLFSIEPDRYRALVDQARANVAAAEAAHDNAAQQLKRARELIASNAISPATLDERIAQEAQTRANVLQQKAALELAQINLGYTEIRSPIVGRIGAASVSIGNLVGANSGTLATVLSEDPIYVNFSVSARKLFDIAKQAVAKGENPHEASVKVKLPDGSVYQHAGKVNFVDNQVNPRTDTVMIRAQFPNPDRALMDGQYATTLVEVDKPAPALVIPQATLQTDQTGRFVLVVDPANKVVVKRVEVRGTLGSDAVIESGLAEGERVILQGIQKVRPGQVVEPTVVPDSTKAS